MLLLNEEKTIRQCLDSLLALDYPKDKIEILMAEGNSADNNTRTIIEEYTINISFVLKGSIQRK